MYNYFFTIFYKWHTLIVIFFTFLQQESTVRKKIEQVPPRSVIIAHGRHWLHII